MRDIDEILTVRNVKEQKKEELKKVLPIKPSAQKEFIRNLLAKNQEKFEQVMDMIAECDPVKYAELYTKLSMHMIPKQNQLNVSVGLNADYQALAALGMTKVGEEHKLGFTKMEEIQDTDFIELKELSGEG